MIRRATLARGSAALTVVLALALPHPALGGGEPAQIAQALLAQPETYEGGSVIGPPESRATWTSFGAIRPVDGDTMLLLSTGEVGGDPLPGTDLGAVGGENDIAGLNLSLRVPSDAHSLRLAYRILAPAGSVDEDVARILVQGDPLALDPWTLDSLAPGSEAVTGSPAADLAGTPFEEPVGSGTSWMELVHAVGPDSQIALRLEVRDAADDPLGDFVFVVDGLLFDAGIPEGGPINPGHPPLLRTVTPPAIPQERAATILVSGRDFPPEALDVAIVDPEGTAVVELDDEDRRWISAEQIELDVPPLAAGTYGLRLGWPGGAIAWHGLLDVHTPVPRNTSIQPAVGPTEGGGLAVLQGLGFYEVSQVLVGTEEVGSYVVTSAEQIELVLPPGDSGAADVALFAAGGHTEVAGLFTYQGLPPAPQDESAEPSPGRLTPCNLAAAELEPGLVGGLALLGIGLGLSRRRRGARRPGHGASV